MYSVPARCSRSPARIGDQTFCISLDPSLPPTPYIVLQPSLVTDYMGGKKGEAIPVTGRGGPQGCETSRPPYFLDNRLTDGGKVASPTRRPSFTSQEDSWYSFLLEAESTPGP
jgi:hypothetical protein